MSSILPRAPLSALAPSNASRLVMTLLLATSALSLGVGCDKKPQATASKRATATESGLMLPAEEQPDAGPTRKAEKQAAVNEQVRIPSGTLIAGSTPGDDGRDPLTEPVLLEVELGPYEIDKLPYPNDPSKPPRTGVTRDEARALCQERGQRLCTELEWEHACKGPSDDLYAAGDAWDPACAKDPNTCASGFGALAMGGAIREWTASDMALAEGDEKRRAVVRGAASSSDGVDHRCAHRTGIDATAKGADTGFRCCKGPPNAAAIPPPKSGEATFTRLPLDIKRVAKMVADVPKLAPYAKDLAFFNEEDSIKAVLSRGDAGAAKPGPVLTTSPILWTPVPTEEVVVMALKAKGASLILAFYRLSEDRYRLASSLVLKDETGPVVLSFTNFNKKRVSWSTCWECSGEQGATELRDGKRIVILHY